jgi:hypothetical protein
MSFAGWVESFEGVGVPSDLAGLGLAVAHRDRFDAKLAVAVAEFEAEGLWALDGAASPVAWLRARGLTPPEAHRIVLIARKLKRLPVLAAAWLAGEVNGGQVQAVNANVVERHVELFASHEAELVPTLVGLSLEDTTRAMSLWRARADALADGPEPADPVCEARLSRTLDNRGMLTASLDAEGVALATAALDIADSHDLDVPAYRRRGQALKDVFRWFLDHQTMKTNGRKRPHLNIVIRDESIHSGVLEGVDVESGLRLDSSTLERLMCDCEFHRLLTNAEGVILDYGRTQKDPSVELYNAVVARDQHCRGYGCDRPASWCQVHHTQEWHRDHGPTSIHNLVLQCGRCHPTVHRKGWTAVLHPDGQYDVTTPWGETRTTYPPGHRREPKLDWGDQLAAAPETRWRPPSPDLDDEDFDPTIDYRALTLARLVA